ncbi:MAG: D-alanyl-D-alanine carboxypeptidase/D-alanyl-D-alanine-endopeptidase [Planctomycetota bacterium]|nr:D-alanyl-D-alanine carboxypeptidase/D-alanyl-D-alanine-endopeptidase [Planctomycetota bacterium]
MSRLWRVSGLGLLATLVLAAPALADLGSEVRHAIRGSQITKGRITVSIRDVDADQAPLVSILWDNGKMTTAAETPMIPASNMKLLTTGAALHVLGPDFVFQTKLIRQGSRLIVVGDGDPAFGDPELLKTMTVNGQHGLSIDQFLDLWIKPVVDSDLDVITEVIVDDRIFEREYAHPSWPLDQLNRSYCAEVSGFNFHLNVLHFFPRPTSGGGPPQLTPFEPMASWMNPRNRASSRTSVHDQSNVWIARKTNTNELTFYGNVKYVYRAPVPVTLHDVPEFFAHLLAERLHDKGVSVQNWRVANDDDPIFDGELIAPIIKTPIAVALKRCNVDSENLYAESLLKRTSHARTRQPSTWATASGVMRQIVHERLELASVPSDLIVADGSGLSRDNRVSASTLTRWLGSFHRDAKLGPMFKASMAVAGENGTMRKRFRNVNLHGAHVQAKSGYINQVSCLSGYVTMPDGRCYAFSVLANGLSGPGSVQLAKKLQERVVSVIAQELASVEITLGGD